jgi:hypothetical protein
MSLIRGLWDIADVDLDFQNPTTAYVKQWNPPERDAPVFKFPSGVPAGSTPVRINCTWDICERRGMRGRTRPIAKRLYRVYPIEIERLRDLYDAEAGGQPPRISLTWDGPDAGWAMYADPTRGPWLTWDGFKRPAVLHPIAEARATWRNEME